MCIRDRPSGTLTIGNYFGALKNHVAMQEDYDCIFSVADLHAITVKQEPEKLYTHTLELYAIFLAVGLDPETVSYTHLDVYKRQQ